MARYVAKNIVAAKLADYTFDLSNAQAQQAYDNLFGKFYIFNNKINFDITIINKLFEIRNKIFKKE
jgi:S-adenosylmethionine synthetase